MRRKFEEVITSEEDFREIMGQPSELVTRKAIDHIDENCQSFIEQSSFIVISSADLDGNFDASPKGDPAGFVKVLDAKTLAIPDRLGNRRADTFTNVLQNPKVGVVFLVPGVNETLRVNGAVEIIKDKEILELLAHKGKLPNFAMIVHVEEAFLHCGKCVIRSKLWANIDPQAERKVPTLAKSMLDHAKPDMTYEEMDARIKSDEIKRLY